VENFLSGMDRGAFMGEPYILITADTHAGGSHAQYREYLDPEWREPFDAWRGGYKNPALEHYGSKKMRNWDFDIRTRDQDSQGVVGEVVFPNTVPPFFKKSIVTAQPPRPEDFPKALAGIRAHNRWLRDFCAEDPVRRAGIGLILPNDLDEAIKDIEFIARAGLRGGVLLPLIPPDCPWLKPLYDPAWDRVYAAIQDHGLVMNQHSGQGLPDYGKGPVAEAIWILDVTFFCQAGYRHLLMSGVFERFPKLRYILTESGCSWVPAALKQMDRIHMGIQAGAIGEMNYKDMQWVLKDRPSEYAARHCWYGASFPSTADLDGIEEIGEGPRPVGQRLPALRGHLSLQPAIAAPDILGHGRDAPAQGAGRECRGALTDFDLAELKRRAAKVGPTPEQVSLPLPREEIPRDSMCYLFTNALYGV
jgi:predicted TIM-barrel fold metal-dependent hydrolase